jgi:hypothetical protein
VGFQDDYLPVALWHQPKTNEQLQQFITHYKKAISAPLEDAWTKEMFFCFVFEWSITTMTFSCLIKVI